MAPSELLIAARTDLAASELADVAALVAESRWNQVEADWRIFLAHGALHTAAAADGRIVATTATLPFGGRFAWISMVLVAGPWRRRGLATLLMNRAMAELAAASLVPVLDATPDGREVYRRLGFQDSWTYHRYRRAERTAAPQLAPAGVAVRSLTDTDWLAIVAADARAFGVERGAVLAGLRGRLPAVELVAERDGRLAGFLLGRDGRIAGQCGPLIAEDDDVACALILRALAAQDGPLFIDLADAKPRLRTLIEAHGFSVARPFTRMLYRTAARFDDAAQTYAVAGPELG